MITIFAWCSCSPKLHRLSANKCIQVCTGVYRCEYGQLNHLCYVIFSWICSCFEENDDEFNWIISFQNNRNISTRYADWCCFFITRSIAYCVRNVRLFDLLFWGSIRGRNKEFCWACGSSRGQQSTFLSCWLGASYQLRLTRGWLRLECWPLVIGWSWLKF